MSGAPVSNPPQGLWAETSEPIRELIGDLTDALQAATARVHLANSENNAILSAWLPGAKSVVARAARCQLGLKEWAASDGECASLDAACERLSEELERAQRRTDAAAVAMPEPPDLLAVCKQFVADIEAVGYGIVMEDWPDLVETYGHAVNVLHRIAHTHGKAEPSGEVDHA